MMLLICIALYFAFPPESNWHKFANIMLWLYAILFGIAILCLLAYAFGRVLF